MAVAALITWIIAALGGFYLLATWLQKGGLRKDGPSRFPAPLIFGHMLLAAAGLVVWLIYVIGDSGGVAWTGFVLIVLTALLGFTMFARWLQGRQAAAASGAAASSSEPAAEQSFPVAAVAGHGLIAAVTLVLVLIAALM